MDVPEDATEAVVKFYPQVWGGDMALTGSPFTFTVPIEDAMIDGELVEENTEQSDHLREHENAPEKARKWQGPFYVAVDEVR